MENTQNAHSTEPVVVAANKNNFSKYVTPAAIIIAGALIALSLYTRSGVMPSKETGKSLVDGAINQPAKIEVQDIAATDHIKGGDKNATVVLIEYSDTECPFCKLYQTTLSKLNDDYGNGKDNKFAWVYRHFPLSYGDSPLHKRSAKEAEATECAAELGGEDMFWKYTDQVYETTTSNDTLDPAQLPAIAVQLGLDKTKFMACLDSGKYADKVKASYDAALKAGAAGTPYTVIRYKGENIPLVNDQGQGLGALPYETMKQIIDNLLSQK